MKTFIPGLDEIGFKCQDRVYRAGRILEKGRKEENGDKQRGPKSSDKMKCFDRRLRGALRGFLRGLNVSSLKYYVWKSFFFAKIFFATNIVC